MGSINIFKPLSTFLSRIDNFSSENFLGNAGKRTMGCWVRSKYAASVLCIPHWFYIADPANVFSCLVQADLSFQIEEDREYERVLYDGLSFRQMALNVSEAKRKELEEIAKKEKEFSEKLVSIQILLSSTHWFNWVNQSHNKSGNADFKKPKCGWPVTIAEDAALLSYVSASRMSRLGCLEVVTLIGLTQLYCEL